MLLVMSIMMNICIHDPWIFTLYLPYHRHSIFVREGWVTSSEAGSDTTLTNIVPRVTPLLCFE
jgi:hypothetical protein